MLSCCTDMNRDIVLMDPVNLVVPAGPLLAV